MIILTYWRNPVIKHSQEDYDEIQHVRLKTVKDIPNLILKRPKHCTMISTERSSARKTQSGDGFYFKIIWEGEIPPKTCPTCGHALLSS